MLVINGNVDLVKILASLSIKKIIIELIIKIIEKKVNYKLFIVKHFLNAKVYFLITLVSKKWHQKF